MENTSITCPNWTRNILLNQNERLILINIFIQHYKKDYSTALEIARNNQRLLEFIPNHIYIEIGGLPSEELVNSQVENQANLRHTKTTPILFLSTKS